ncbi:MAG: hypothetical protein WC227_03350 [Patescibacteria group bacterium]
MQKQTASEIAGQIVVKGSKPGGVDEAIELIQLLVSMKTRAAKAQILDLATQYSEILQPEVRAKAVAARMAMIRPVSKRPEPELPPVTVLRFRKVVTTTVTEITVETVNQ